MQKNDEFTFDASCDVSGLQKIGSGVAGTYSVYPSKTEGLKQTTINIRRLPNIVTKLKSKLSEEVLSHLILPIDGSFCNIVDDPKRHGYKLNHVDGVTLEHAVQTMESLDTNYIHTQLVSIITALLTAGFRHNDIKSDNIMLVQQTENKYKVFLIDFDLLREIDDYGAQFFNSGSVCNETINFNDTPDAIKTAISNKANECVNTLFKTLKGGKKKTPKVFYKGYYYNQQKEGRSMYIHTKREGKVSMSDVRSWQRKNRNK